PTWQVWPSGHLGQSVGPPQSSPLSWPLACLSKQVGVVHIFWPACTGSGEQARLTQSTSQRHCLVSVQGLQGPPQSVSASSRLGIPSVQVGALQVPSQCLLWQSASLPLQVVPSGQGAQGPPQSLPTSFWFSTPSWQVPEMQTPLWQLESRQSALPLQAL